MNADLRRAAHAVMLPAFDGWDIEDVMARFLGNGGCSVLVGESRAEYVGRKMSADRRSRETAETFAGQISRLKAYSDAFIVAVDEEISGIRRLEGLVPDLPSPSELAAMPEQEIERLSFENAKAARAMGVTMYLAPIVDVVDGSNIWLAGRTLGATVDEVSRVGCAFIRGVQRAGITAVTKHFPGFNHLEEDPALADTTLLTPREKLLDNARSFSAAIAAGTRAIMVGPAPVAAIDLDHAACTSAPVVDLLRRDFDFTGLVVSDDLDAPATMRGHSLLDTALASLNAGVDLLLLAGGPHVEDLCAGIVSAVEQGRLSEERLLEAAMRVRAHAVS